LLVLGWQLTTEQHPQSCAIVLKDKSSFKMSGRLRVKPVLCRNF
jgi:hypothetical protein